MDIERIVYCLYCPKSKTPVYIGKSKKGLDRPWTHFEERSHSKKVNDWVFALDADGLKPIIVILDQAENDEILSAKESFWIQKYLSDGHPLLNLSGITPGYFLMDKTYDPDDPCRYIRSYIYHKRKQVKLTQKDIAEKAGVGLRLVRELEQGKKSSFNIGAVQKILNLFSGVLTVSNQRDLE